MFECPSHPFPISSSSEPSAPTVGGVLALILPITAQASPSTAVLFSDSAESVCAAPIPHAPVNKTYVWAHSQPWNSPSDERRAAQAAC